MNLYIYIPVYTGYIIVCICAYTHTHTHLYFLVVQEYGSQVTRSSRLDYFL